MNRMSVSDEGVRALALRAAFVACAALSTAGCANEPVGGPASFSPMMLLNAPANAAEASQPEAAPPVPDDLSRKSLAAKVLAARALESVTGLTTDPARLSEHD